MYDSDGKPCSGVRGSQQASTDLPRFFHFLGKTVLNFCAGKCRKYLRLFSLYRKGASLNENKKYYKKVNVVCHVCMSSLRVKHLCLLSSNGTFPAFRGCVGGRVCRPLVWLRQRVFMRSFTYDVWTSPFRQSPEQSLAPSSAVYSIGKPKRFTSPMWEKSSALVSAAHWRPTH